MKKVYVISVVSIIIICGIILGVNNVEQRNMVLTDFKNGEEYQFGEVAWHSSVKDVEAVLDCKLEDVTIEAPKDYGFYDISDVVYFLDGHEAKVSIEFQTDKLVYIDFAFDSLEEPKPFFEKIVSAWQEQYGLETMLNENEKNGYISYHWKTETTQLAVALIGREVRIFLAFLK